MELFTRTFENLHKRKSAPSAGAGEFTDYITAEG